MTHLLALEAWKMGVEGLFSSLTLFIMLHTFHISPFFKTPFHSHIFHHSSSFLFWPFHEFQVGGDTVQRKKLSEGLSRCGHKHWLRYPRQCEMFILAVLLHEQPNSPATTFLFTALFSAYLGATVSNMLSVVSTLSAEVLFPATDLHILCFPGLSGNTARLGEQFSQRQSWFRRDDTICPGVWCGSHWNRPLSVINTFHAQSLPQFSWFSPHHIWDNYISILSARSNWFKGPPRV